MKSNWTILLFASFIACSPAKKEEQITTADTTTTTPATIASTSDSTAIIDNTAEVSPEIPDDTTASDAPISLTSFAQYPTGYGDYASIIQYLNAAKIEFTDTPREGIHEITFDQSNISILVTEAYGDLLCSARIYNPRYKLPEEVKIGMRLDSFLSRTSLTRDSLSLAGSQSYYETKANGTTVGGTGTVSFWFENERLLGIQYGFDPCMIYD